MIYKVQYSSMTARYGPSYIEANSEEEARLKFAGTSFSRDELSLISARPISVKEIIEETRDAYAIIYS